MFFFPDPEELDIPTVSKSVEIATSSDVTDVDSFIELLQLPGDEEVIPTQPSSSPVKLKRRATPIQAAHNELEKRLSTVCHNQKPKWQLIVLDTI